MMRPEALSADSPFQAANPKSVSTTRPSALIMTFSGLTSR